MEDAGISLAHTQSTTSPTMLNPRGEPSSQGHPRGDLSDSIAPVIAHSAWTWSFKICTATSLLWGPNRTIPCPPPPPGGYEYIHITHAQRPAVLAEDSCARGQGGEGFKLQAALGNKRLKKTSGKSAVWGTFHSRPRRCSTAACSPTPFWLAHLPGYCVRRTPPPPNPGGVGGWVRGQKKVCVPKITLKIPAPLIDFIFCWMKILLMWGGGGSGPGLARAPNAPPPQVLVFAATGADADEAAAFMAGSRALSARMVVVHERPVRATIVGALTWLRLNSVGSVLVFTTPAVVHSLPLGPNNLDLQLSW